MLLVLFHRAGGCLCGAGSYHRTTFALVVAKVVAVAAGVVELALYIPQGCFGVLQAVQQLLNLIGLLLVGALA